uniref:FixH family protein n=1 Tax=Pedobacter schmidteae TaxID=2201271 RepID=UPI000EAD8A24|nr:FixH family protein [Pedobacter schmidteae]
MRTIYIITAILSIAFASCKKETTPNPSIDPTEGLIKISTGYAPGAATMVELWAQAGPSTGYNPMVIVLRDSVSNQLLPKADLKVVPLMDMNMNGMKMTHSAPAEQPSGNAVANAGFPFAAIFTMPGSEQGKWYLDVTVRQDGKVRSGTIRLPLEVKNSLAERVKTITAADGSKLSLAFLGPHKPKVGINDFELTIHRRQDMMNFPAVDDYSITMTPEMPSMGHGSPNNINPVIAKDGHYKGKVNFTMTGDWRINLELTKNGQKTTLFFDLTF